MPKLPHLVNVPLALLLAALPPQLAAAEGDKALTLYGVVLSSSDFADVLGFNASYQKDYRMVALAYSEGIAEDYERIDLEWEAQIANHIKGQDHWELNGLVAARWLPFPWDHVLDTSLAFGAGLSYATELPEFEQAHHDKANDLLAYLMVELELRPPASDHWSLVFRVHHRSGAYELFDGVRGASNAVGIGLKYRFD